MLGRVSEHVSSGAPEQANFSNKLESSHPTQETNENASTKQRRKVVQVNVGRYCEMLKKPYPEKYTGHCGRRSSATNFALMGGNESELKRFGRWKSASVAQSYISESVTTKRALSAIVDRADKQNNNKKKKKKFQVTLLKIYISQRETKEEGPKK